MNAMPLTQRHVLSHFAPPSPHAVRTKPQPESLTVRPPAVPATVQPESLTSHPRAVRTTPHPPGLVPCQLRSANRYEPHPEALAQGRAFRRALLALRWFSIHRIGAPPGRVHSPHAPSISAPQGRPNSGWRSSFPCRTIER
jgi:hypothetical protein